MTDSAMTRNVTTTRPFAAALVLCAAVAFVAVAFAYPPRQWGVVVALAAVAAIAERRSLQLAPGVWMSVAFLPMALAAVVLGPLAAAVVGGTAMLGDLEGPPDRFAIYTAGRVLEGVGGGMAAVALLPPGHTYTLARLVMASAAAAVASSSIDFAIVAVTLHLRGRLGASGLWAMLRGTMVLSIALYAPITSLFAYAYQGAGEWVILFFLIPVLAAHRSLGMHARQAQLITQLEESNRQLGDANQSLRHVNLKFAAAMVQALDSRDRYTAQHSKAVAVYSRDLARELGLSDSDVARVHLCGLVHDIGKIGVPAAVLEKQSALDEDEWVEMRRHSQIGQEILAKVDDYADVAEAVRSHHERLDGAGYPDGLTGDRIPLFSKMIAVVDAYNAMTSDRPYRQGMTPERAIGQLELGRGTQFEPVVVDAFLAVLARADHAYRLGAVDEDPLERLARGELDPIEIRRVAVGRMAVEAPLRAYRGLPGGGSA
jgi:putative nucleotidyltransferase with HDIG domain